MTGFIIALAVVALVVLVMSARTVWWRYSKVRCGFRGCAFLDPHNDEIESDFCHCGSDVDGHGWADNHSPVPMVCPPSNHSWDVRT